MTAVIEPTTVPGIGPDTTAVEPSLAEQYVGSRYLKLVLVLGALSAIGPLTIDTYLPALPSLTAQFGATDVQAQTTITGLLVGLGLGQLVIGPLSDAVGRRKPLLLGLAGHGLMSVLCALAPSITLLAVTRTLQGVAGAAVAVVAMAMVRDLFSGYRAAQLLSRLVLVLGVAPILAPSLGSALLKFTSWQGIFVALAVAAVALFALAFFALPETLPPSRRIPAKFGSTLLAYRGLFRDRTFLVLVAVAALMFSVLFCYVAGSSFILQDQFGLNPQQFGIAFSTTAVGMIIATQINPLLLKRWAPIQILSGRRGDRSGRCAGAADHLDHRASAGWPDSWRRCGSWSPRSACPSRTHPPPRSAGTARPPVRPRRCSARPSSCWAGWSHRWSARWTTGHPSRWPRSWSPRYRRRATAGDLAAVAGRSPVRAQAGPFHCLMLRPASSSIRTETVAVSSSKCAPKPMSRPSQTVISARNACPCAKQITRSAFAASIRSISRRNRVRTASRVSPPGPPPWVQISQSGTCSWIWARVSPSYAP